MGGGQEQESAEEVLKAVSLIDHPASESASVDEMLDGAGMCASSIPSTR